MREELQERERERENDWDRDRRERQMDSRDREREYSGYQGEDGAPRKASTPGETYFLMPCGDGSIRPLRMRALRKLTLSEFRMSHLTAMRLTGELSKMGEVFDSVHSQVLGDQAYSDLG